MPSFNKANAAYKTITLFFYAYTISEQDKQNILNTELALCHLKQLSFTDLFAKEKTDLHASINANFYFVIMM